MSSTRHPGPARSSRPTPNVRAGLLFLMRSVPAGSFERLTSPLSLWHAYLRCRLGKRRQPAMATFDLDADTHLFQLHRELLGGTYRPGRYRLHIIRDPKTRLIAAAPVRDRVLHQSLVGELGPHYERSFLDSSFAACTGRGAHRALLYYLRCCRQFRFRLSLDIRRYFPSIRHEPLLALWFHRLKDEKTRALLSLIVRAGAQVYKSRLAVEALGLAADPLPADSGLPIGSYVSQWSGALYLDGLDHFVKRTLKIPGYLRYMDDFSLFSDDEAALVAARTAIERWLQCERGLMVGRKRWEVYPTQAPSRFVGYRVSPAGVAPGPKVRKRIRRRVRAAAERGEAALLRTLASYRGIYSF